MPARECVGEGGLAMVKLAASGTHRRRNRQVLCSNRHRDGTNGKLEEFRHLCIFASFANAWV